MKGHYTHGLTGTRVYRTWESMKARCYNPNDLKYPQYGGRGIIVCSEWLGKNGAKNFADWAYSNGFDESKLQKQQSIDRIDVNGNYCPENCRFTNAKVQANNKTNTVLIEYNGRTQSLQEWSDELGIKEGTIRWRLKHGHSIEDALCTSVKKMNSTGKRYEEYNGERKTVAEWARFTGISENVLYRRLQRGWSIERALNTPIGLDKWHKNQEQERKAQEIVANIQKNGGSQNEV